MTTFKLYLLKSISAIVLVVFIVINIPIDNANADPLWTPMVLVDDTCWVTGEPFKKCVHAPSGICDSRDQGTCSSTDPEVD